MKNSHSNNDFYSTLPLSSEFNVIEDLDGFYRAPDSWWIVIADVKNSTDRVNAGHYKQVNMVGASCIAAVLNTVDNIEIPFVFGGDGATLLIPDETKDSVRKSLVNVRVLAQQEFAIQLRIGFVGVNAVRQFHRDVLVAKYQISRGNNLAMFSGGGIELADQLIKHDTLCEDYALPQCPGSGPPDLSGLSCRWQPLKSSRGKMICLLIQALDENTLSRHQILSRVLSEISIILGDKISSSNPVTQGTLRFNWPPDGLKMEASLTKGSQSFLKRYLFLLYQSLIQTLLERFNLSAGDYNAPEYREELQANADYRRFDDALRLVLDCSKIQIESITKMLQEKQKLKLIAYGLHQTDQAQMTCLVFSLKQSEHIHFIDGTDGGFWAAAEQYKKQLNTASQSSISSG